jgi:hypothetical protein
MAGGCTAWIRLRRWRFSKFFSLGAGARVVLTRVAVIDCVRVSGRARGERRWGRGWLVRGVVAACGLFVSGLLLKHCGGVFWLVWSFCFALPALHCTVLHCPTRRSLSMCASAPPIYLSALPRLAFRGFFGVPRGKSIIIQISIYF